MSRRRQVSRAREPSARASYGRALLELGEVLSMRALAADLRQQYPEYSDYLQAIESACLAVDLPGLARLLQFRDQ